MTKTKKPRVGSTAAPVADLKGPKILFFDIETAPNLGYIWGKYEQNVIEFTSEFYMLSWSAKWMDGKHITRSLSDYSTYKPGSEDDKDLVTDLWHLLNEADLVIGHNGDKFDIKKTNTRMLEHGLPPPEPYKTVDTLKVARKYFAFNSNKLDDLGRRLGVGRKVKHAGFELWKGCMSGDAKAWTQMKRYNCMDVILLENVYDRLKPWITGHPNVSTMSGLRNGCPNCGSLKVQKRGFSVTAKSKAQRYQCQNCSAWSQGATTKVTDIS